MHFNNYKNLKNAIIRFQTLIKLTRKGKIVITFNNTKKNRVINGELSKK